IRLSEPVPAADSRPAYPAPKPERAYNESPYPSTELRILAAYKIWGMVHYFFAYRDLMDEDWDDLLPAFLPKFIAAKDGREYNLVVAEMVSHMADSHAIVESEALTSFFGKAPVGLRLRLIERKPLVTEILDEDAKQAGVQVGDIVSKVDGESLVDRFRRETPYMAASTQQSLGNLVIERILNGPEDSTSTLTITDREGRTHEVHLKRSSRYFAALRNQRTGEIIKRLATNVGYADLDRLMPDQVDSMFEQLRDTKAILFDMRGCPHESMATLASRLTDEHEVPTAIFTGPLALSPDISTGRTLTSTASYFFVEKLPESALWKYKGKTAMLIDERTIGEAEHTGLFLEVANKTAFVGSASAGADGEVTRFVVPGGITIHFSGRDVRHANGGKLQRLGLQPNVNVTPTIQGIRSGRDEVLEKAVEYVSK
ncbi:MAG: hypothetical protein JO211_14065, partial [Acidobacteriaceae bacterium]|nr:hypothetical protein [Acidobacteriaceae bacterium]